jgi:hypothetical protein
MGSPPLRCSWPLHPRREAPHATTPACTGAPARHRETQHTVCTFFVRRLFRLTGQTALRRCLNARECVLFPHTAGEAARIKKPQPGTVGVGPHTLPPLSLARTPQRHVGQVSWLAAFSLLSAPSQGHTPQWSLQISFRSQLRGSDGFAPSSLVTVGDYDHPYQRHIQFDMRACGSARRVVKDILTLLVNSA